jgi:hypothetical protein
MSCKESATQAGQGSVRTGLPQRQCPLELGVVQGMGFAAERSPARETQGPE